jgi:signal transduction histidine kinase
MKQRTAFVIAWSVWAMSMLALLVPVAYRLTGQRVAGLGTQSGSIAPLVTVLLFIPIFATVGAVLAAKRPRNPLGWLVLVSGLCYALGTFAILVGHFSTRWSDWLQNWVWGLGIGIPATLVLLLFPTGRLPSRRWRPVAWLTGMVLVAIVLGSAFQPGVIEGSHSINPLGVGGPIGSVFKVLRGSFGLIFPLGLAAVVSLVFRFRRANSLERQQIKWLVYAAALLVMAAIAGSIVPSLVSSKDLGNNLQNAIISGAFVFVPLAIGVAVMKYRLYDIDVVINKTLVYALLAAFITVAYVAIVVGVGQAIGSKRNLGLSILATAVVAVGFQPVRNRVQHFANRLVYGKRATPYEVLSEFSERMSGAYAAEDLLPRMARILAEGTGAARADVWLNIGSDLHPEASWPPDAVPPEPIAMSGGQLPMIEGIDRLLPVLHRGQLLGALSVVKARGDPVRPAEEKLMEDLASGAGLVLRNVRLTAELLERLEELKRSRQRIVAAQDEERRKLERNLHDGAQQQLVALQVRLSLAERLAEEDCRVKDQLASLKAEAGEALENLRDLARGIYPPLLADQGLQAALSAQARKAAFPVKVEAQGLSRYPQEQEAAVYFCMLEALQNVAKYANATHALVRVFEQDGALTFEVTDDGAGFDTSKTSYGTGMQGMADRLSAQGGTLEVRSAPGEGTTVVGRVPVGQREAIPV